MPATTREAIEKLAGLIDKKLVPGFIVKPLCKPQSQEGPNCGFYALSIVMDYWKSKGASATSFHARLRDVQLQGRDQNETAGPSLRSLGKQTGALDLADKPKMSTGGVFTAQQLAVVAKATKIYDAAVITESEPQKFIDRLCQIIKTEVPPIVAFDVVKGDPSLDQKGQHSHWGVVFGYAELKGVLYFLATHGHGSYYSWEARLLQASNFALNGTQRDLAEEQKIKIEGRVGDGAAKAARPQWRTTTEVDGYELKKPQNEKLVRFAEKGRRPASAVLQDLAHHIIRVAPAGQ